MKCTNCGTELENGQTVCPDCAAEQKPVRKTMKQRKKEKIKKIVLSVTAGVLAVALVVTLVLVGINDGWGKENNIYKKVSYGTAGWIAELNRNSVVATAGEYTLTNAQLQILYTMQVLDYVSAYGSYISLSGIDITKPLSDQIYDKTTGMTWEKFFLQEALLTWGEYCVLNAMADEVGFEISEEFAEHLATLEETVQKSAADEGYKSVDAMLQADLGQNVRYEDYYNYLSFYYKSNLYTGEIMDNLEITTEDLEKYFKDNEADLKKNYSVTKDSGDFVDVRHILIMPEGGTKSEDGKTTTYSDKEWEECRAKAQAIYDEWLAGDQTAEHFGKLANEKSQDQDGKVTNGGLYENVSKGQMVTEFNDWCFDETRNPGDHGLVKTQYGYHVMYFVAKEPIWVRYCRAGIQHAEIQELVNTAIDALEWEIDFSRIVLDNIELT